MKIGNIEIKSPIFLAPMAGISNSAFRRIAKEMNAGLVVAEMVSDKAIYYNSKKTIDMLYFKEEERPISQQIFGSDLESFIYAAKYIEKNMKPDIIDINMGCPVPKVALKSQAGSALLKDPLKVYEIVKEVVSNVSVPVTVKIRSGWDKNNINALEIAKICEKAGASAITIHPRTREQGYTGSADWNLIKQIKENVNIPVIGNGDIKTPEDAKKMMELTKCDAVMIGRALIGNPWLIKQSLECINNLKITEVSNLDRINMALKHLEYLLEFKSEKIALLEMRTHICHYLNFISKEYKNRFMKINTLNEFKKLIGEIKDEYSL